MARPSTDGINFGLLLALLGSVLLHLGVLFALSVGQNAPRYAPRSVEARLVAAAPLIVPPVFRAHPAPPPSLPAPVSTTSDAATASIAPVALATSGTDAPVPASPANKSDSVAAQPLPTANETVSPAATYYPVEQLDAPPRRLGDAKLVYPERARREGVEGFTTLSLLINERGEVDEIHVVKSQPSGFFEESAIAMLRGQRFTPAIRQGNAAKSRWQETVRFRFQN